MKRILLSALLLLFLSPGLAWGSCVAAVSEASRTPKGEWKYDISVEWQSTEESSGPILLAFDLELCGCICDNYFWSTFGVTSSTTCDPLGYLGRASCIGDEEMPCYFPVGITYRPQETEICTPLGTGSAILSFMSEAAPEEVSVQALVMIQLGDKYCLGYISGDLPSCFCLIVEVEEDKWSTIKGLYR